MSQKETVGTSEMKPPPPPTSGMQPRPSTVLPRAPWSMSHVMHGQPMMNMRPFYHMIHVPSPLAIPSMFMQPRPNIQHHSGDGAVSGCAVSGCQARAILPACRACENSSEVTKTKASCSASGTGTHDVAFLKFQKNAQLHGIKITSTNEKPEQSGSSVSGRLSVASPEFTPHAVIQGSDKTSALPESHLPDVIVVSSDTDDEDDASQREDAINSSKDEGNLELQTLGEPLTVNAGDNGADYSECLLSSEMLEVEGQESESAPDMGLHSDGDVYCIGCTTCSNHREMVSTYTQTDFTTIVENSKPLMIDNWTSTEDLKNLYVQESTGLAAAAASIPETDYLKLSHGTNEISEVSMNVSEGCCLKAPSLDTIYDSMSEEEVDLSRVGKCPEMNVKSETNALTPEECLLFVSQERSDNLKHQLNDVSDSKLRQKATELAITNSSTSNTSSSIVREEELEQNSVNSELERWERAEISNQTNGIASSTSSVAIKKENCIGIYNQPTDFRDECRRRNVAAVEAVCEMFETDKVASDADIAADSVAKVDNYLSTLTELNIKFPEVSLSCGPEDVSRRIESLPVSAFFEDQRLDGSASSTAQFGKLPEFEERNDLSNVFSRSGRSSVDNSSVVDNIRRQQKGPSSSHSDASARKHTSHNTSSRNICLEEAVGASLRETVRTSKSTSIKGRENGALQKAYNTGLENLEVKRSISLLENDCSRNVETLADDESLSGSENMSVAMSISGAELKSDCSSMANSLSQIGFPEPNTELMDMIKSQLLLCDPALVNNPQMLETLAVQQLYLMHHEHMVLNQMMEAMRQHQQPQQMLLMQQHSPQQGLTPQQLLVQQHLVAQQQLAQSHLLPTQQFAMLPQASKPQKTLPPRFAARLPSQGESGPEVLTNMHSAIPESSLLTTCTSNAEFHMGSFAEPSELQNRLSQGYDLNQSHNELSTVKNQESVIKMMDYNQQERSLNSVTNFVGDIKDDTLTASAGNGLSVASAACRGKRASSVSSVASATFRQNGERPESAVTSPAVSSHSAASAQKPDSSACVSRSGNIRSSGLSDYRKTEVCGDQKLFLNSVDTNSASTVPVNSVTKPSYSSVFVSEKAALPVPETAESRASDHSVIARGRGSGAGAGGGVRPKSVTKIDNIGNGASADGCLGSFRSQEQSRDFVKFNKGEYGKEKAPELKRSTTDQLAMGGDSAKNRKPFVPDKAVVRNRWEGPVRRTSTHMQESEEDWGEAGSATWIKNPVHYGPPKCSATRVKPKTEEW